MFNNRNNIILQFDIILNNEASVFESFFYYFGMESTYFHKTNSIPKKTLCLTSQGIIIYTNIAHTY
jgi:hypothetical protein